MPGYVTHYIFGREVYHNLKNNSLKKNLYYNRAAYGLGLQGPDIFFYYLPSYVLEGHNIGALAHVRETSAFFQGLIESRNQFSSRTDLNIAEAYLIGFLGHYTLDTICHPYIYAMTHYKDKKEKAYFSRHAYLETDIDTALLDLKLHRQPCNFHTEDTIRLTPPETCYCKYALLCLPLCLSGCQIPQIYHVPCYFFHAAWSLADAR